MSIVQRIKDIEDEVQQLEREIHAVPYSYSLIRVSIPFQ